MIRSFCDKEAEKVFENTFVKKWSTAIQKQALFKLIAIHAAVELDDLRSPPGNRLEKLKGDLKGYHSIRVNDQFRIVFRWLGGYTFEVILTDYHD